MFTHTLCRLPLTLAIALALALPAAAPVLAAAPANDDFANATLVSALPFSNSVEMSEATFEPGEGPYGFPPPHTVWYTLTPASNMLLRLDLSGSSEGRVGATLYRVYFEGFDGLGVVASHGREGFEARLEAGVTYYLQAVTFDAGVTLVVVMSEVPPPPNDDFAAAMPITQLPFSDTPYTGAATAEEGEQTSCAAHTTVWYSLTPAADVVIHWSTLDSGYWPVVNLYKVEAGSLSDLGCSLGEGQFLAQAGATYYFQIGNASWTFENRGGQLAFTVTEIPGAVPPTSEVTFDRTGTVGSGGMTTISGVVTCSSDGNVDIYAELEQVFAGRFVASSFGFWTVPCSPAGERFSMEFSSAPVHFGPGRAELRPDFYTCSLQGFCRGPQEADQKITLRAQR
jgi:hypothetical protein